MCSAHSSGGLCRAGPSIGFSWRQNELLSAPPRVRACPRPCGSSSAAKSTRSIRPEPAPGHFAHQRAPLIKQPIKSVAGDEFWPALSCELALPSSPFGREYSRKAVAHGSSRGALPLPDARASQDERARLFRFRFARPLASRLTGSSLDCSLREEDEDFSSWPEALIVWSFRQESVLIPYIAS